MMKSFLNDYQRLENLTYMRKKYTRLMRVQAGLFTGTVIAGIINGVIMCINNSWSIFAILYLLFALLFYTGFESYKDLRDKAGFWEKVIKEKIDKGIKG